jgi:hypothetical protein
MSRGPREFLVRMPLKEKFPVEKDEAKVKKLLSHFNDHRQQFRLRNMRRAATSIPRHEDTKRAERIPRAATGPDNLVGLLLPATIWCLLPR